MIENFMEYMWYLLHTPLKKLKKSLNKWYVFCKVFGKRLDEAKEDILRARDEGMIATCSHEMLPIHGAERRLTRYEGEHPENFRSRIAMFEEICKLGGTNEGVILAVKSLGFQNVDVALAKYLKNDETRWAEFYVLILLYADDIVPVGYDILRKEVRKTKQVSAKDNYQLAVRVADIAFPYGNRLRDVEKIKNIVFIRSMQRTVAVFYTKTEPEGAFSVPLKANIWNLEKDHILKSITKIKGVLSLLERNRCILQIPVKNQFDVSLKMQMRANIWNLEQVHILNTMIMLKNVLSLSNKIGNVLGIYLKNDANSYLQMWMRTKIWNLEKTHLFKSMITMKNQISVVVKQKNSIRFQLVHEMNDVFSIEVKNNLWDLDGMYCLDGTQLLNAYELEEEL